MTVCLSEDVASEDLERLRRLVRVAGMVQVVPRVVEQLDIELLLLRIANLLSDYSCTSHDSISAECTVVYLCLLTVTTQVIELVDIETGF